MIDELHPLFKKLLSQMIGFDQRPELPAADARMAELAKYLTDETELDTDILSTNPR